MADRVRWPTGWGPSHQEQPHRKWTPFRIWIVFWLGVWYFEWQTIVGAIVIFGGAYLVWFAARVFALRMTELDSPQAKIAEAADPLKGVLEQASRHSGAVYLGTDRNDQWRLRRPSGRCWCWGRRGLAKARG